MAYSQGFQYRRQLVDAVQIDVDLLWRRARMAVGMNSAIAAEEVRGAPGSETVAAQDVVALNECEAVDRDAHMQGGLASAIGAVA